MGKRQAQDVAHALLRKDMKKEEGKLLQPGRMALWHLPALERLPRASETKLWTDSGLNVQNYRTELCGNRCQFFLSSLGSEFPGSEIPWDMGSEPHSGVKYTLTILIGTS